MKLPMKDLWLLNKTIKRIYTPGDDWLQSFYIKCQVLLNKCTCNQDYINIFLTKVRISFTTSQ